VDGKLVVVLLSSGVAKDNELVARDIANISDFVEKGIKQVHETKELVYRMLTYTNR
jgi:hypothetical protein